MRPLLAMLPALFTSACLLPPEGHRGPDAPYPPEVDFTRLTPEEPFLRLRPTCPSFDVEVGLILDQDSRDLRTRWVVNNNLPGTRLLRQKTLPPLDPGTDQEDSWRLVLDEHLDTDGDGEPDPSSLSFFVTDAPGWADPDPPTPEPDVALDLGLVTRGEDGIGSTVEVRWSFLFAEGGPCR